MQTVHVGPSPKIAVDHMGNGELVLFLHGIGGNKRNWQVNLPAFAKHFHAAAWDARGYGESEDYEGPLDFSDFREDLLRVVNFFGVEKAHIVGLSMGGRIAASFHALYPERVASLVLCDTHLGFAHFSEAERAKFVALRKEPLLAGKEPKDIAPRVAETLIGDMAHTDAYDALVDSMARLHKESYIKSIEASVELDHAELFARVRVPTLVVVGALDRLTPPSMAKEIQAKIPSAQLRIIENAGHLPNIEQPAAFDAAVLPFLLDCASS